MMNMKRGAMTFGGRGAASRYQKLPLHRNPHFEMQRDDERGCDSCASFCTFRSCTKLVVCIFFAVYFTTNLYLQLSIKDKVSEVNPSNSCRKPCDFAYLLKPLPKQTEMYVKMSMQRSSDAVTMATQLSWDRWNNFIKIDRLWDGPISATVFVLPHQYEEALQTIREHPSTDNDIHIVTGDLEHEIMYPVNYLRNVAMSGVQTEWVFINDIDFMPATQMSQLIRQFIIKNETEKTAYVVPAFEMLDVNSIPDNNVEKYALTEYWKRGYISPFRKSVCKKCHEATQFEKWFRTAFLYTIRYRQGFEPYVILRKKDCPKFDETYVGRWKNKMAHTVQLALERFEFKVLPNVFLIHWPHRKSVTHQISFETKICFYISYYRLYEKLVKSYEAGPNGYEESDFL